MGRTHAVRLSQEGADIVAVDLARDEPGIAYGQGTPDELAENGRTRRVRRAHQVHYVASKHGIQGLVGGPANELGPHGIRVNCVNPGTVDTEMALNESLLRNDFPDGANPTKN